ncbi:MAG: hypothetical protein ABSA51_06180 [Anaerolineaceae bacterium]|jgi:hypothetical protein
MKSKLPAIAVLFVSVLLCSACGRLLPQAAPTATPIPTQTPVPSVTPTPAPGRVILVAPDGTAAQDLQAAQSTLKDLAGSSNMVFETRPALQASDITADVKIVVFLTPPANLSDLTNAAGQTQFVVVSTGDLPAAANLTVIRLRQDFQAFIAGYVGALIAYDWRLGGLLPSDNPNSTLEQQAFANGEQYFCGLCNPQFPPFVTLPQITTLASNSDPAAWQSAFDQIYSITMETVYVAPEASSPDLLNYLAAKNLHIIGGQSPTDDLKSHWAATVLYDPMSSLKNIWPSIIAGKGGQTVAASVQVTDTDDGTVGQGKMRLINETISMLMDGSLLPLSTP